MKKNEKTPELALIGMSHKTAPVEIREKFVLDNDQLCKLTELANSYGIEEIVYISTCNRMEIYFVSNDTRTCVKNISSAFEKILFIPECDFEKYLYIKYHKDAVRHLFKVASSLDSMVPGENEILGQIKEAYRISALEKNTGTLTNRLFHQAFQTAKRVKTETEITKSPVSVAYIASELAKKIFEDLSKRRVLLIGAGEMGELILKYLTKHKIKEITIANRSFHNAQKIVEEINSNAHIVSLEDIINTAEKTDIIISSVSSADYILTKKDTRNILKAKKNEPLFIIDIAVPRNIDPELAQLNNIFLYNIDDLKSIADENLKSRIKEFELAETLIESDVEDFFNWYEGLAIVPAITNIQKKFDYIRKNELNKYKKKKLKHLSKKDLETIENLTKQIMTKTLHDPIMYLKSCQENKAEREQIKHKLKLIEDLFGKSNDEFE
jgi:glutamyl-tRNA reductase